MEDALEILQIHYGQVIDAWPELTIGQRDEVLERSPLLARLAGLTRPMREMM